MPDNVFDWEPICATLMKERGPDRLPPQSTFMSTAEAVIVNLHREKGIPLRDLIRDCTEMLDKSEYDYRICEKKHQADDGRKKFGGMPMKVITRRLFFGLAQSWLEGMLEKACETAVAGVDDYDIVPSNQDIRDSEPDWDVVTNVEDWIWVEKTDAKN